MGKDEYITEVIKSAHKSAKTLESTYRPSAATPNPDRFRFDSLSARPIIITVAVAVVMLSMVGTDSPPLMYLPIILFAIIAGLVGYVIEWVLFPKTIDKDVR